MTKQEHDTLCLPAVKPWPEAPEAERWCARVERLEVDLYGQRERSAGREWPRRGLLASLGASSAPGASDLLLRLTRERLLGALLEAATLGETAGPRTLALLDEALVSKALRERFPRLREVRVGASEGAAELPPRERARELYALLDALAALGVRCEARE